MILDEPILLSNRYEKVSAGIKHLTEADLSNNGMASMKRNLQKLPLETYEPTKK